jgi:hypothetical protein
MITIICLVPLAALIAWFIDRVRQVKRGEY